MWAQYRQIDICLLRMSKVDAAGVDSVGHSGLDLEANILKETKQTFHLPVVKFLRSHVALESSEQ